MHGYAGTILRIDLSCATVVKQPLDETLVEGFIGGRGFVAKLLFDELPRGIDPYAAENIFIAASGPLSGYLLPASGKTHFGTKSPASGGYADSNMGGHFGPALKYAGYDMLVLTGVTLLRCHKSDLAVLVLMVVPVHKSLNPLPDISQIFKSV